MLVERLENGLDDVPVSTRAAFHMDVRLLIGGASFVQQSFEGRFRVAIPELRPGVAPRGPLGEDIDGRVEPNRDRPLVKELARAWVDKGAAACCDDADAALVDEARDEPPLAVAEIGFPVALEYFRRRKARRVLDGRVAVDERQAEPPREAPSDRRLSNSHQPDQHKRPVQALPEFYHSRGYTAAHPLGKSARMSRLVVLIIVILLIVGGLFFLSTVPKEKPTHTIEVAVPHEDSTRGNAH